MKCPQPGWPWQSRLSRLKSQGSWTVYTLAAEWNDQNGQLVRWYYASRAILPRPICARGGSQHRSPDLAAPRRRLWLVKVHLLSRNVQDVFKIGLFHGGLGRHAFEIGCRLYLPR